MTATIEVITPDIAKEYLKRNHVNRNISIHSVIKYAEDMKSRKWQLNGEAIKFDTQGNLRDGQHRLSACVRSGVPFETVVIRDIPDDSTIFDSGRNRNILDIILFNGKEDKELANASYVAVARLHAYSTMGRSSISANEVEAFLKEHEQTLRQLGPIKNMGHDKGITIKNAGFLLPMMYALEYGEPYEKIKEFAEVLNTGICTSESQTPAVIIRNDVLLGKINIKGGANDRKRAAICIENAIKDFCDGTKRKKTYSKATNRIYSILFEK